MGSTLIQKIETVLTAGKSLAQCRRLLRASGNVNVGLELINPERKKISSIEVTEGEFVTSG